MRTITLFTKAVPDKLTSWLSKFSSVRLVAINIGIIDVVGVRGTRRAIREYKRAHGVPGHGKTANNYGLEQRIAERFGFGRLALSTLPRYRFGRVISPEDGLLSRAARGEVDPPVLFSKTGE